MLAKNRRRTGFSLIELLVVIAIIAILIGLILPAVQKVRGSALRTQCANNLKQIGVALHTYHDNYGKLPPGYSSKVGPDNSDLGPGWGWAAHMLPFVEQTSLHSQLNFTADISASTNSLARAQSLAVFRCPADDGPVTFMPSLTQTTVAFANYVGMFGTEEVGENPGGGNGVFYRNSSTRLTQISDGCSNTIMVGERSSNLALSTWAGAVTGAEVSPVSAKGLGPEGAGVLCLGHAGHTPNNALNHVDDFCSRHFHGANFVFADGSIRTINDGIAPEVWKALGTRAGGEPYSVSDF